MLQNARRHARAGQVVAHAETHGRDGGMITPQRPRTVVIDDSTVVREGFEGATGLAPGDILGKD